MTRTISIFLVIAVGLLDLYVFRIMAQFRVINYHLITPVPDVLEPDL